MIPADFPETNNTVGPPEGMTTDQVQPIKAYLGLVQGGAWDGIAVTVVAWKPDPIDLERLNRGAPVFLRFMGGTPVHYMATTFEEAKRL